MYFEYKKTLPLPAFSEDADVVKLVDTLDLGSSAARRGGSSPSIRTTQCSAPAGHFSYFKKFV